MATLTAKEKKYQAKIEASGLISGKLEDQTQEIRDKIVALAEHAETEAEKAKNQ